MPENMPPIYPVECKVCGHAWYPRSPDERPRLCPKCHSLRWDTGPRKPRERAFAVA